MTLFKVIMDLQTQGLANFLAHVDATPMFELGKEAFACIGVLYSVILLLKFIIAVKRRVRTNPPKQITQ